MNIAVEKPEIITISYRQERGDKDYGSCLWARFNFDLKHYSLTIESDCGNYCYGWTPTPGHESFLKLCARFHWDYLLDKISSRSVIASNTTFQKVKELAKQIDEDKFSKIDDVTMEELESNCHTCREELEMFDAIWHFMDESGLHECDSYDIACCIEKDYPRAARTIAQIYHDHIQPVVKKLAKGEQL